MTTSASGPPRLTDLGWSPDGTRLAFARDYGDRGPGFEPYTLFVVNADGTGERDLARALVTFAWSPDSSRIAYTTFDGLYVIGADGSSLRKIADSAHEEYFDWAPDGMRLAYTSGLAPVVHVVDADGANDRAVVAGMDPRWSPDGRSIAYAAYQKGVMIVRPDGSGLRSFSSMGGSPRWSPDGKWIAWVEHAPRSGEISIPEFEASFARPVGGGEEVALGAGSPLWSPKSDRAAMFSMWTPALEIAGVDGKGRASLRDAGRPGGWSPDGSQLTFDESYGAIASRGAVGVASADGTGRRRVTVGVQPRWSPSSDAIAFIGDGCPTASPSDYWLESQIGIIDADGGGRAFLTPCQIELLGAQGSPDLRTVHAFESVTWLNRSENALRVSLHRRRCSGRLAPGGELTCRFDTPGVYEYEVAELPSGGAVGGEIRVLSANRSVGLFSARTDLVFGQAARLFGEVRTETGTRPGELVQVLASEAGTGPAKAIEIRCGDAGSWSTVVRPSATTTFKARWGVATSTEVRVRVHPRVTLARARGGFLVRVYAARSFRGRSVIIERRVGSAWKIVGRGVLGRPSVARLRVKLTAGRSLIRARVPKAIRGYEPGLSRPLVLRVS